MKLKNKDLAMALINFGCLKGLSMDGDIALSSIKMKKRLSDQDALVHEAKREVMESACDKKEDGTPCAEMKVEMGREYIHYKFSDPKVGEAVAIDLKKIDDTELEIPNDMPILVDRISKIKCSPEQMEALLMLTPQ